jgi:hypothetical protein
LTYLLFNRFENYRFGRFLFAVLCIERPTTKKQKLISTRPLALAVSAPPRVIQEKLARLRDETDEKFIKAGSFKRM